jgi:hypothetical protein
MRGDGSGPTGGRRDEGRGPRGGLDGPEDEGHGPQEAAAGPRGEGGGPWAGAVARRREQQAARPNEGASRPQDDRRRAWRDGGESARRSQPGSGRQNGHGDSHLDERPAARLDERPAARLGERGGARPDEHHAARYGQRGAVPGLSGADQHGSEPALHADPRSAHVRAAAGPAASPAPDDAGRLYRSGRSDGKGPAPDGGGDGGRDGNVRVHADDRGPGAGPSSGRSGDGRGGDGRGGDGRGTVGGSTAGGGRGRGARNGGGRGGPAELEQAPGGMRPGSDPLTDTDVRLARLLPVPIPRPEAATSQQAKINLVALVLAALMVAAVGVVALTRGRGTPVAATTAPAATTAAPAAPATAGARVPAGPPAPTGLRLRDGGERVTLTWTNPPGTPGPVEVAAGRAGQEPRPFQQLPAGTDSHVVFSLRADVDYCFTVSAVRSDKVGTSAPVCTDRR